MTFCCVECRLLQASTTDGCRDCGSPMVAPIELVRELLYYRDMNMVRGRDWGMITALIAGGSLAFPVLTPVALASIAALGVHKLVGKLGRRAMRAVELQLPEPPEGATVVAGIARRFRDTTRSVLDGRDVLAEQAIVRDRPGGAVLLRRCDAVPFWIERDGDAPVLVAGALRASRARPLDHRGHVRRGDARLQRMGIPEQFPIAGALEVAAIRDAARVAIVGCVEDEAVPELAFHRDAGRVLVLRGRPGAPLVINS